MLVELADDWHESPYRVVAEIIDLPDEIKTVAWEGPGVPRVTGRYVRTGTAPDGVPVFAWIPEVPEGD